MGYPYGRMTHKTLSPAVLHTPPALPERAVNRNSEEARLLGQFSLRRTKNIHKRFIREEMKRTLPPLELSRTRPDVSSIPSTTINDDIALGATPVGLEGTNVFKELERLATPPPPPIPRRARSSSIPSSTESSQYQTRFMRRRFREILAETPILSYTDAAQSSTKKRQPRVNHENLPRTGRWTPSISTLALHRNSGQSGITTTLLKKDDEDRKWIERSVALSSQKKKK